ncbi:MAG: DoxX family membrane protein [Planctomycetota bacterium]
MKNALVVSRVLLGLPFLIFGLNYFWDFMPPQEHAGQAAAYMAALGDAAYVWPVLKSFEIVIGFLLIIGQFVPLALVMVTPIMINIVGFHFFMDRGSLGMVIALVMTALYLYLLVMHLPRFSQLLERVPPRN